MGIEIERKFLVKEIPKNYGENISVPIEQGYLNISPAIRVRRQGDQFFLTYKGGRGEEAVTNGEEGATAASFGIGQTEYNLPLDEETYRHLLEKADGIIIRKTRYILPLNEDAYDPEYLEENAGLKARIATGTIKIELDLFKVPRNGLMMAEVEFPSEEAAMKYRPASWFGEEVTNDRNYSNAHLSMDA